MTTDERLDRLTERVDGLAHSVELLAGMQIETEKRVTELAVRSTETEKRIAELAVHSTDLQDKMATLAEVMAQLTRVVLNHSERIENLEGNQPH